MENEKEDKVVWPKSLGEIGAVCEKDDPASRAHLVLVDFTHQQQKQIVWNEMKKVGNGFNEDIAEIFKTFSVAELRVHIQGVVIPRPEDVEREAKVEPVRAHRRVNAA
ncbi:MAG: hypothetical protein AMS22_11925 [Thiotrichales bacterium SG8_50]|nr:MAG: hypothetical protein AMS22_11925 [Thiotrichales bacterium SG8_50]